MYQSSRQLEVEIPWSARKMLLTIAKAKSVRVNSGPKETIILSMNEIPRHLIAIGVGKVITIAAETNRKAHKRPDIVGPVSEILTFNRFI